MGRGYSFRVAALVVGGWLAVLFAAASDDAWADVVDGILDVVYERASVRPRRRIDRWGRRRSRLLHPRDGSSRS
jgi:hypothetical protein